MLSIKLLLLFSLGKKFPWKKPLRCPRCASPRLWGHGFVMRYFSGFSKALWIKRYRCPECSHVFSMRPSEYFPGFQYPRAVIIACIIYFAVTGKRSSLVSRQLQYYWTQGAVLQANRFSNVSRLTLENIRFLIENNIILSSHCLKQNSNYSGFYSPHRFFPVTDDFTFT